MSEISVATARVFAVRVAFFSGAEPFAVEAFEIEVPEGQDPLVLAGDRAERSAYWNDRVPDLSRTIDIQPVDPDEPDPPSPSSGGLAPGRARGRGRRGAAPPVRRGPDAPG